MKTRHSSLCAGIMAFLLLTAAAALAGPPAARVLTVSGTLTVRRQGAGAFAALAARGTVQVGDIVGTGPGSAATLLFSDGSQIRLPASSATQITEPTPVRGGRSLFHALSGEVWARLRPGRAVQTRGAIAGAVGTEIDLKVDEDTTTLTVIEGAARFSNLHGEVMVGTSQQSVARPGAAPTAPITVQNAGMIIEWTLNLDRAILPREEYFVTDDSAALAEELQRRKQRAQSQPDDAEARRDYGDALFDSGKPQDALREYRESERLAPGQAVTLAHAGSALLALGSLEAAEASFRAALSADSRYAPAPVGLALAALAHNRPAEAQAAAEQAVGVDADSAEAQVGLGLALMRQPGKLGDAATAFQAALKGQPANRRYQARAWLALVRLAQDDAAAALADGQAAAQMAPRSALAHGNLALVCFFNGRMAEAEREARLAVRLDPDTVAGRCALGQALLARGDVDAAVQVAAQAVVLDPSQAQAHYLLGVGDAQRRDYRHAARELEACLRLAPDFLPAAGVLARVYTSMGRKREAVAVLQDLLPRHRETGGVRAALGMVYHQQARYAEAETEFREAISAEPNSALHHSEMARLLIDANRLDEAITEGQQAVRLAPTVGQCHAVLGLAYGFSRMSLQAEREFRQALAMDPQNALALLELGLKASEFDPRENRIFPKSSGLSLDDLLKQGMQLMNSSLAVGSVAQAFLHDPAVSGQVLRGGIDGELRPGGGSERQRGSSGTLRTTHSAGALRSLGFADYAADDGNRANDDSSAWGVNENITFVPGPQTTVFGRYSYRQSQ